MYILVEINPYSKNPNIYHLWQTARVQ